MLIIKTQNTSTETIAKPCRPFEPATTMGNIRRSIPDHPDTPITITPTHPSIDPAIGPLKKGYTHLIIKTRAADAITRASLTNASRRARGTRTIALK